MQDLSEVPKNSCFGRFITAVQYEVKCNRLTKNVRKWFDETQGKGSDLTYRFTGRESGMFCQHFMRLIKAFNLKVITPSKGSLF